MSYLDSGFNDDLSRSIETGSQQLEGDIDLAYGDGSFNGRKIKAQSITTNELNFVAVTDDNVIASINASEEGLLIEADNIEINGDVTFSAGYDPTEKVPEEGAAADVNDNVTKISGGKITTQSMNWAVGYGGSLTLGGSSNVSGTFSLENGSGTEVIAMSNIGITVKSGGDIFIDNGGDVSFKGGQASGGGTTPGELIWRDRSTGAERCAMSMVETATSDDIVIGPKTPDRRTDLYLGQPAVYHYGYAFRNIYGRAESIQLASQDDGGSWNGSVVTVTRYYVGVTNPIDLTYSGSTPVNLAASSGAGVTITHNYGQTDYYVMLANEQQNVGDGYMDYITHSVGNKTSSQFTIYYINHNTGNTAKGDIYWQIYRI